MKYISILFVIIALTSCTKNNTGSKVAINNIITVENSVSSNETDEEKVFVSLSDEEIRKMIYENIFYGINRDPNFYINNKKYTIEYDFDKEDLDGGIAQDTNYMWIDNDCMRISFANNMLISVEIIKKTDMYFLGKFIGENISEIDKIFEEEVMKWQHERTIAYEIKNNKINYGVDVTILDKYNEKIQNIRIGITGILSNGMLPKIEKE